jgi:hypothetical protein
LEGSVLGAGLEDPLGKAGTDPGQAHEVIQPRIVDPDSSLLDESRGRDGGGVVGGGFSFRGEYDQEGISAPRGRKRLAHREADEQAEGQQSPERNQRPSLVGCEEHGQAARRWAPESSR